MSRNDSREDGDDGGRDDGNSFEDDLVGPSCTQDVEYEVEKKIDTTEESHSPSGRQNTMAGRRGAVSHRVVDP